MPGGTEIALDFQGVPGSRAVLGHYPVHATFQVEGSRGRDIIHPIAIFQTVQGQRETGPGGRLRNGRRPVPVSGGGCSDSDRR
jgi:hypothetical protein